MSKSKPQDFAVDTSVFVAALSAWHPDHVAARSVMSRRPASIAHVLVETFSVLTRLPAAQRVAPRLAAEAIRRSVHHPPVTMPGDAIADFLGHLCGLDIAGGSTYDALIAETARRHGMTLYSLDRRARPIYASIVADVVWIGDPL